MIEHAETRLNVVTVIVAILFFAVIGLILGTVFLNDLLKESSLNAWAMFYIFSFWPLFIAAFLIRGLYTFRKGSCVVFPKPSGLFLLASAVVVFPITMILENFILKSLQDVIQHLTLLNVVFFLVFLIPSLVVYSLLKAILHAGTSNTKTEPYDN